MYCMKVLQALRGRTEREIMNAPLPYVLSIDTMVNGGIPYLTSTFLFTDRQRVLNLHEQTIYTSQPSLIYYEKDNLARHNVPISKECY